MSAFTTHLSLGQKAFVVQRHTFVDCRVATMTVGQIRVTETDPRHRGDIQGDEPLFLEQYMCLETGVGSGTLWEYGKNIFATEADAQAGVVIHHQRAYKERELRDARVAEQAVRDAERDRQELARLQKKLGAAA